MTDQAQNPDFPADSPFLLEIEAFGGRRKKTAGSRSLGCVTLGPSPLAQPQTKATKPIMDVVHLRTMTSIGHADVLERAATSTCPLGSHVNRFADII